MEGKTGIILADLNSGPAVPSKGVNALFLQNYQSYLNQRFYSPYVTAVGECTFCVSNPLHNISGTKVSELEDQILDHVLVRNDTLFSSTGVKVSGLALSRVHACFPVPQMKMKFCAS